MTFDNALNIGTLITIFGFGITFLRHMTRIEFKVNQMWDWWSLRQLENERRRERERDS